MGLPVAARASPSRRRGVGAISLAEVAAGGIDGETGAVVLMAFDALSKTRDAAVAARAAQSSGDLSRVSEQAEAERDAARASSIKWATGAAATAGSIAAALATFGGPVGVAAGAVIGVVAGAALAAYAGYQRLADIFEHDADAPEYVKTATDYAAWFVGQGLPFPQFRREVYKNVQGYADALKRMANSIIGHPAELRAAVERTGRDLRESTDDLVVQAAYLTAGEHARQWPFERLIAQANDVRGWGTVSDREALEILTAAIGTSTARTRELPAIHVQAVIDEARAGWNRGALEGINGGHFHPGILAMAYSKLAAEAAADSIRATIDAVAAVEPGLRFVLRDGSVSDLSSSLAVRRLSLEFGRKSTAPAEPAGPVSNAAVDAVRPPAPAGTSSPATKIAVGGAVVVGGGILLLKTAAGALLRRAVGL